MTEKLFLALSIVIGVVIITLGIMRALKQPMIIWYILAGTVISIFLPQLLHGNTSFHSFSMLWISFLLFIVGMELNPRILKDLGKSSLAAGILQVALTGAAGFWVCLLLGYDPMTSLYVWGGFAFSSTIVVLKLLGDKDETHTTFGRMSIGILIVQDLIVMLAFMILATIQQLQHGSGSGLIALLIGKVILIWFALRVISKYFIPMITKKIAESQEYLFLFAIGRCFILGSLFQRLGFWMEIWTLIAGITLANSAYRFEIISRVKVLKDFFIVMFFVLLWSNVDFQGIGTTIIPAIILTVFVLVVKPILMMCIGSWFGHTKKNNFLIGTSLGQISEFSFLLVSMGIASGYIRDQHILSLVTLIGLLSIAGSSYFILYGDKMYHALKSRAKFLPGHNREEQMKIRAIHEIILFGYGRLWSELYASITDAHEKTLIIDENPETIAELRRQNISCMYGDAGDHDFLQELNIQDAKMIISTIRKYDDAIILLKTLKEKHPKILVILVAHQVQEAINLYESGADYVILPHHIGASHTSMLIQEYGFDPKKFLQQKEAHLQDLKGK